MGRTTKNKFSTYCVTSVNNNYTYSIDSQGSYGATTGASTFTSIVTGMYLSPSNAVGSLIYLGGIQSSGNGGTISSVPTNFEIGGRTAQGNSNRIMNGHIAEVIYYNRGISDQERAQVQSYLGIKYGISIAPSTQPNYLASDGGTVWGSVSNTGYTNTVLGIGFDSTSGLNQKQSTSSIVTSTPFAALEQFEAMSQCHSV